MNNNKFGVEIAGYEKRYANIGLNFAITIGLLLQKSVRMQNIFNLQEKNRKTHSTHFLLTTENVCRSFFPLILPFFTIYFFLYSEWKCFNWPQFILALNHMVCLFNLFSLSKVDGLKRGMQISMNFAIGRSSQ